MPEPLGLSATSADDLKDLVAATFKSLIGEKPFCFLFTILLAAIEAPASLAFPSVTANE
jgi:hypothetical protein